MKYILSWNLPQGTYNATVKRFLETGGAPPKGVELLGRWHGMNGQGFAVTESNDPKSPLQVPGAMGRPDRHRGHALPGRCRRRRGVGLARHDLSRKAARELSRGRRAAAPC